MACEVALEKAERSVSELPASELDMWLSSDSEGSPGPRMRPGDRPRGDRGASGEREKGPAAIEPATRVEPATVLLHGSGQLAAGSASPAQRDPPASRPALLVP